MARGQSAWNKFAAPYLKRDRKGGMKAAAAAWRAQKGGGRKSNPSSGNLMKYALYGGIAYLAYMAMMKNKQQAPAPPAS